MSERALRWYLAFSVAFFVAVAAVLIVRITVVRDGLVERAERSPLINSRKWTSPALYQ